MNVSTLETRAVLSHAHSELKRREDLCQLTCPPATATFRPIPHYELVTALIETLLKRQLVVRREEYAVQRHGNRLFGVLDLASEGEEYGFAIGLRTANDRTLALSLICGVRVSVCDNMSFSGDFLALRRKHTAGLSLNVLDPALDRIETQFGRIGPRIAAWKSQRLTDVRAKFLLYEAFVTARVAPLRLLPAAVDYYFRPVHAEFAPRTAWSLYNSVTETFKTLPLASAFHSAARVGRFFETRLK